MRCKTVAKGMHCGVFVNARLPGRISNRLSINISSLESNDLSCCIFENRKNLLTQNAKMAPGFLAPGFA
jgi:hypothetical protein